MHLEETPPNAMVAIDEVGFDWSYMAKDEVPTNLDLMAFLDPGVYTNNTCSKTCLKSYETLKKQYDDLKIDLNKVEFELVVYKKGLASIEEQLIFYKNNMTTLCENIAVLTRDMSIKDAKINVLKSELEKIKQEKEGIQFKIEKINNASKSLDKLLGSQITDKSKNSLGFQSYNAVPPPATLIYNTGSYGPNTCEIESKNASEDILNKFKEYLDDPLVKDRVSDNKDCSVESTVVVEKKFVVPTIVKVEIVRLKQQENKLGKQLGMLRCTGQKDNYNNHQREMVVSRNNYTRVNYNNSIRKTHPNAHRNMAPRAVSMKIGLRPLNTARPVNTAHPKTRVYSARPMSKAVNTSRPKAVSTARPNAVNTAWPRPTVVNAGHPQKVQEDQRYVNSRCSRHMTGNMSYLLDFKEFNKGYVTFRGGENGGRITGKGTIKTNNLDYEDVYLVKELKFNLFSFSQIVDMKNIIPKKSLTCLVAKATLDESMLWHRRLGHIKFKNINKLVKDNLVRGLPSKHFENDQAYVACLIGKLHKASCKFDGKADEGFFVGYSMNSKAFRVYHIRTRRVEENLHIEFLENNTIVAGNGPEWLFIIDTLTNSINYMPAIAGTNSNDFADGLPIFDSSPKLSNDARSLSSSDTGKKHDEVSDKESVASNVLNY
nr:hypothetical protein [Tanacetum cinerariifolium]